MKTQPTPQEVNKKIFFIRNCRVMLDSDLAHLYQVETKNLNKAVKRNMNRFPEDFMFQITAEELAILRFQAGTPKVAEKTDHRGGRRNLPFAFMEQGVAMLSSVLRSERAVMVNIEIMRTFVKLKELLLTNKELAQQLSALEQKYDVQFKVVFDAIRQLMNSPEMPRRRIGI